MPNLEPLLPDLCFGGDPIQDNEVIDVAIIGAGAAGAYAAYRIMHAEPGESEVLDGLRDEDGKLDVRLFERSDRIGGRLWSLNQAGLPTIELGGQGFSPLMQNVYGLCKKLGLRLEPCSAFNMGPQLQYFRQRPYRSDLYNPLPPPPPTSDDKIHEWCEKAIEYFRAVQPYFPHLYKIPPPIMPCAGGPLEEIKGWCEKVEEHIRASPSFYPNGVPYFLCEEERWQTPDALILNVLLDSIPGLGTEFDKVERAIECGEREVTDHVLKAINKLIEFLRGAEIHGCEDQGKAGLSNHGFWNLLDEALSTEAYNMAAYSSFAYSMFGNWNLYDSCWAYLMITFIYKLNYPFFYEVEGGYQQVPVKLLNDFIDKGGKVYCRHKLHSVTHVKKKGEKVIALDFHVHTSTSEPPEKRTCYARKVILAMPKRALELLAHQSDIFKVEQFRSDINAITAVPSIKIFMPFKNPWWKKIPNQDISGGWSTTDMPMRACYYMDPTHPDNEDENALLLASFNDEKAYAFWANYFDTVAHGRTGMSLSVSSESLPEPGEDISMLRSVAPKDMVRALRRQLTELHGINVPAPLEIYESTPEKKNVETIYQNWTKDPYGGGWHNWNPHVKSWEVMPRIRRLSVWQDDAQIFLCGEAYSAVQGWVEGALNTAEMVLEDYFGLDRPDWVENEEYDFGP